MKISKSAEKRIVICGIIVTVVLVTAMWVDYSTRPLTWNLPARKVPKPNAFDYFIKAESLEVFSQQCMEAVESPGLYAKPPSAGYLGMKPQPLPTPPKGIPQAYTLKRPYTLAEKKALIKANEPVFKTLKEGLKYEYLSPSSRSGLSPVFMEGAKLRELARLLSFKIKVHSESGEYDQAMQTCLDGIELGSDISQGAPIIGYLVLSAVNAIVRKDSALVIDRLDSKQARAAAARLEEIQSRDVSFKDILQEEKYTELAICLQTINSDTKTTMAVSILRLPQQIYRRLKWNSAGKQNLRMLEDFCDKAIEYASKPYAEYIKAPAPDVKHLKWPIPQYEILNTVSTEILPGFRYSYEYNRWANDRLLLGLALRAYKLENAKYPARLADLAPGYLKRLPKDPFASKGPYKYRSAGGTCLLYSIGPDGKDDGGKPAPIGRKRRPDMNAKGDLAVTFGTGV